MSYIWLLSLTSLALWLGWVSIALILDHHYHSIKAIGLELFVLTTVLFFWLTRRHKLRLRSRGSRDLLRTRVVLPPFTSYSPYSGYTKEEFSYQG